MEGPINHFCSPPQEALVVLPSGEISACFEIYSTQHPKSDAFILGQLTRGQLDFNQDLWRKIISRTGDRIGHCQDCFLRWHCAGDCLSKTFRLSGSDHFTPSCRCFINQELTKLLLSEKIAQSQGIWLGQEEVTNGS